MTKKIFRSICLVALLVFFSSLVLIMGVLYDYFSDVLLHQLKVQTNLISQGVTNEGIRYFDGLYEEHYRITWMDASGKILYDSQSDSAAMENHLEREEIRQALAEGYGDIDGAVILFCQAPGRWLYSAPGHDAWYDIYSFAWDVAADFPRIRHCDYPLRRTGGAAFRQNRKAV